MTYNEALVALKNAQDATWYLPDSEDCKIHDGITQAIEVFKRMEQDLKASSGKQSGIECDLFAVDFQENQITFQLTCDQLVGEFHKGTVIIDLSGICGE